MKIWLEAKFRIFSFPVYCFDKDNVHFTPQVFMVSFRILPERQVTQWEYDGLQG